MGCRRLAKKAATLVAPLLAAMAVVSPLAAIRAAHAATRIDPARREAILRLAADRNDRFWGQIATHEPTPSMSVRKFFATALTYCEAGVHPERMERLFQLAAEMQDRDTSSPGFGNMRWYWRDDRVTDRNAVEFSMQDAALVWLRHRQKLPEPVRQQLRELIAYGVEGCLRHRVPTSYTNIAVLNASNLILLGELLDRPEAADEGYRRLDALVLWTWQFGTHEYCSPTYYYPDLSGLMLIEAYARRDRGRRQARALAELLWTDVAANWFPPAARLAGPQSRSYDYLRGLGGLNRFLWVEGWLGDEMPDPGSLIVPLLATWSPPERLHQICTYRFPRLVRQSWGEQLSQSRTHMLYPDVTLGCAAAAYGLQDLPLTVDLPGDRNRVHCYFIADGREDPYGRKKYETGSARHMKALHLAPFWAGAQRECDALGLVIYRDRDRDLESEVVTNVQSHFVLRRPEDGAWLDGRKVDLPVGKAGNPSRVPVGQGQALVLRYGTAGVAIRLVWSRMQDGKPAPASLVDDGDSHGAIRLTVEHRSKQHTIEAGAAFWVRVASGLESDERFASWRKAFEQAHATAVDVTPEQVRIEVPGGPGPVSILAEAPYGLGGKLALVPEPSRAVLELDGQEIGRPLLESVEPVRSFKKRMQALVPIQVPANGNVSWEAETGLVFPGMVEGEDQEAAGGRYVWQPDNRVAGGLAGTVTWPLRVAKAGRYWLWGRVLATTPENDSFYVEVLGRDGDELLPRGAWHTGHRDRWSWEPVALEKAKKPTPIELPAGQCRLVLRAREFGTRIDRLFITPDPNAKPE